MILKNSWYITGRLVICMLAFVAENSSDGTLCQASTVEVPILMAGRPWVDSWNLVRSWRLFLKSGFVGLLNPYFLGYFFFGKWRKISHSTRVQVSRIHGPHQTGSWEHHRLKRRSWRGDMLVPWRLFPLAEKQKKFLQRIGRWFSFSIGPQKWDDIILVPSMILFRIFPPGFSSGMNMNMAG